MFGSQLVWLEWINLHIMADPGLFTNHEEEKNDSLEHKREGKAFIPEARGHLADSWWIMASISMQSKKWQLCCQLTWSYENGLKNYKSNLVYNFSARSQIWFLSNKSFIDKIVMTITVIQYLLYHLAFPLNKVQSILYALSLISQYIPVLEIRVWGWELEAFD